MAKKYWRKQLRDELNESLTWAIDASNTLAYENSGDARYLMDYEIAWDKRLQTIIGKLEDLLRNMNAFPDPK